MRASSRFAAGAIGMLVLVACGTKSSSLSSPPASVASTTTVPSTTVASTASTTGPAPSTGPPTTKGRAPTTSTTNPAATTTTLATPETLAPNQSEVPPCAANDLAAAASTDRGTYTAGQNVHVTVIVTNRGARTCAFQNNPDDLNITDQSGTVVYPTAGFGQPGCPNGVRMMPPTYKLTPGQSFVAGQADWDQNHHACHGPDPGPRYPAGQYTANPEVYAQDGQVKSGSRAGFQLT